MNTDEDLVCTQCLLCNRQLVDGILCLRPRSVRPARGPPTPPARAAAKTRTASTAQTSAAARAAFAAQAVATARAAAKVEPIGLSNPHSNGSPLMAWGWETANICQSKLSWVLLGFGEWKADKASPHTLGGTRLEESQGTGLGGAERGYCGFPLRRGVMFILQGQVLQTPATGLGLPSNQQNRGVSRHKRST